ncbi:MAG TPA: Bax inhibitor-1/YccA family protein [Gemmatimonadales bacterium]|nr:Bax inhibitor-1/YccA family protein [Gemmatimonadales bacterium]
MATISHNPVLRRGGFDEAAAAGATMTLGGTVAKTFLLLGIAAAGMVYVWAGMPGIGLSERLVYPILTGSFVFGVVLLIGTSKNPEYASITGPIYAAVQGLALGVVTLIFEAKYPGLPKQAALLTAATLLVMLVAYRAGWIRATERFTTIVVSCTAAVFVFYIIAFTLSLFGVLIPFLHEGGVIGIGFSLFVVGLAALNLILDFDTIEQGIGRAPAALEWFAAFGLVVTLIWLYFEILRLLGKLRR